MTTDGPLEITVTDHVIVVSGEIDAHSAPLLAHAIEACEQREIRIDMADVEFVDSSGLRVLIDAHQQAEESGRTLHLANPSAAVQRLLEISGVDDYLHVVD